MQNTLLWRQTIFPGVISNVVSQHESAIVMPPSAGLPMFEVNIWGMLFYGMILDSGINVDAKRIEGIHLYELAGLVLACLQHADKMMHALGYLGPIDIEVGLDSIRGVQVLYFPQSWREATGGSALDDDAAFSIPTSSDVLKEKIDGVAMDVLRYILFSLNSPEFVAPEELEDLIRRGYGYNIWQKPASLRM